MTEHHVKAYLVDLITEGQYVGDEVLARDDEEVLTAAIESLDKLQQYSAIGTVEEFRWLKDRQSEKKPHKFTDFYGTERNGCPNCYTTMNRNEILYAGQKYCSVCGQAIEQPDN